MKPKNAVVVDGVRTAFSKGGRGKLEAARLDELLERRLGVVVTEVEEAGGRVLRTKVGDRYIVDAMLVSGAGLGGEKSVHDIVREHPALLNLSDDFQIVDERLADERDDDEVPTGGGVMHDRCPPV